MANKLKFCLDILKVLAESEEPVCQISEQSFPDMTEQQFLGSINLLKEDGLIKIVAIQPGYYVSITMSGLHYLEEYGD